MFGYRDVFHETVLEKMMYSKDEHLPVILTAQDCDCDNLEKCVEKMGGKVKHKLHIINAVAAYIPTAGMRSASNERFINKVYLDDMVLKLMDTASVTIGGDYANGLGLTGKGVGIAVVDTGVYPHNDLVTPNNRIIGFKDFVNNKTAPYDDDGHGTHVAGIIAGNGFSSSGRYIGVAPDADIVGIKVLDGEGSGSISDVIAGVQWAVQNKNRYNIKIINMSLGSKAKSSYKDDPLCQAVQKAIDSGIAVCAAAGNSGPDSGTINSPATNPNALVVGASNNKNPSSNGTVAKFSSRGPTIDGLNKPDVLAPGVDITSLGNEDNNYKTLSGTSMATPIVSGACALLHEYKKNLSPQDLKKLITEHADSLDLDRNTQGYGVLNLKSILASLSPDQKEVSPPPLRHNGNASGLMAFLKKNEWLFAILIVFLLIIL
ncbi:S8 family peptidase [Serpentinicella sp. ANB-PHB4]|uniref:S8 family peptidase n=1 Tax=Serpentinicella sp. ANB-PHB4 TaxID=3074076 RepID=UPI00285B4032|nr:S8 family peptidase [Serpentinicella sp. ANB-PHB4]MDR5658872.1 S8 family peptidase [Serpentinicella sp. ANB-PHB4]